MKRKSNDNQRLLIESYQSKVRVDRDKGMIYDVLILGPKSRNGVSYPSDTRARAVALFEGAKANLSHEEERTLKSIKKPRDFQSRVGKYVEVHNTDDGLRGNLRVLKSHPWAEVLFESAEDAPDLFSCSPAMVGVIGGKDSEGLEVCTEIRRVRSVDLVTDGGTTKGLFEDEDGLDGADGADGDGEEAELSAEEHYAEACRKAVEEIVNAVLEGELEVEEAAKKIKEHLKGHMKHFGDKEEKEAEVEGEEVAEASKEMEEELRTLRLEKECRVLLEDARLDADHELLQLLIDLPNKEAREKHLNYLKRGSLVKRPKSGYKQDVKTDTNHNDLSFLRS